MSYRRRRKDKPVISVHSNSPYGRADDYDDWGDYSAWWPRGGRWFRTQEEVLEDMTQALKGPHTTTQPTQE